jgi:hypothetical protein
MFGLTTTLSLLPRYAFRVRKGRPSPLFLLHCFFILVKFVKNVAVYSVTQDETSILWVVIGTVKKVKAVSTVTGLEWPRGFQEVKVPRFHDNSTGLW